MPYAAFNPKFLDPKLQELMADGRAGKVTLAEFQDRLDAFDLRPLERVVALRDVFRLELGKAKEIQIIRDYGSTDAWAKHTFGTIEELEAEFENLPNETDPGASNHG